MPFVTLHIRQDLQKLDFRKQLSPIRIAENTLGRVPSCDNLNKNTNKFWKSRKDRLVQAGAHEL